MGQIQFKDGSILFVGGSIALDPNCCCCCDTFCVRVFDVDDVVIHNRATISGCNTKSWSGVSALEGEYHIDLTTMSPDVTHSSTCHEYYLDTVILSPSPQARFTGQWDCGYARLSLFLDPTVCKIEIVITVWRCLVAGSGSTCDPASINGTDCIALYGVPGICSQNRGTWTDPCAVSGTVSRESARQGDNLIGCPTGLVTGYSYALNDCGPETEPL